MKFIAIAVLFFIFSILTFVTIQIRAATLIENEFEDSLPIITHKWDRSSHEIPATIPKFKWIPLNTSITFNYEQEQARDLRRKEKEITTTQPPISIGRKGKFYAAIDKREKLLKNKKLFISIASIAERIHLVKDIIRSILIGSLLPTHIYVFISSEPNLLDAGIPPNHVPLPLQYLVTTGLVSIVYTENIGPHRKLLPLLQKHWDDDVLIVTYDDDAMMTKDTLLYLVTAYVDADGKAISGLRVRRMGLCTMPSSSSPTSTITITSTSTSTSTSKKDIESRKWTADQYGSCMWPRVNNGRQEMLVLPTGSGGILYDARLLHPSIFDPELRRLTKFNDDLTFRLASLVMGVKVAIGCCSDGYEMNKNCRPVRIVSEEKLKYKKAELFDRNQVLNTQMWSAGLNFMQRAGLLDAQKLYNDHVLERGKECVTNTTAALHCGVHNCATL